MQYFYRCLLLISLICGIVVESHVAKYSPYLQNLPIKSTKFLTYPRLTNGNHQQKTLVVQIRSDEPVPLILKGRSKLSQGNGINHLRHPINNVNSYFRGLRPLKFNSPLLFKYKPLLQNLPKLKLANTNTKLNSFRKPATSYDVPFKSETSSSSLNYIKEIQKLPNDMYTMFTIKDHVPIHTVAAPNLSSDVIKNSNNNNNHIVKPKKTYLPTALSSTSKLNSLTTFKHQDHLKKNHNHYQVVENTTKEKLLTHETHEKSKLYAPDPDPSVPSEKIPLATEYHNQPSNGKPLPIDVQLHSLPVAQPLLQIVDVGAIKQVTPQIYPVQTNLQPIIHNNLAPLVPAATIPIYNPTYLVTQSNNLYNHHQQQLFKPSVPIAPPVIETGYVNADQTQSVTSTGEIVQDGRQINSGISELPQFGPLIAAPVLDQEQPLQAVTFQLENTANIAQTPNQINPESDFVVSNYYSNSNNDGQQDSSQLLQAYAEEVQAEQLQQYHHQLQQQLQNEQEQLQQQNQHQHQQQQQQQQQEEQQHFLLQEESQQFQQPKQHIAQQSVQIPVYQTHAGQLDLSAAAAAFQEHERLVKQQLGSNTPLRIFVPDEDESRLQKRSDAFNVDSEELVNSTDAKTTTTQMTPTTTVNSINNEMHEDRPYDDSKA